MTRNFKIALISCACATALSACATSTSALNAHSSNFGAATQANVNAHALAPTPEQKANTYIPADPDRREKTRERYKKGEVIEPSTLGTTS